MKCFMREDFRDCRELSNAEYQRHASHFSKITKDSYQQSSISHNNKLVKIRSLGIESYRAD